MCGLSSRRFEKQQTRSFHHARRVQLGIVSSAGFSALLTGETFFKVFRSVRSATPAYHPSEEGRFTGTMKALPAILLASPLTATQSPTLNSFARIYRKYAPLAIG